MDSQYDSSNFNWTSVCLFDCAMKRGALHLQPPNEDLDTAYCDEIRYLYLGEKTASRPLQFKWMQGSRLTDLVSLSTAQTFLISDRVCDALAECTGWSTFPVTVRARDGKPIPGYHGLAVTGRSGKLDRAAGRKAWRDVPPWENVVPSRRLYAYFDPESWDGSDVFTYTPGGLTLVTRRVVDALRAIKVSNAEFRPIARI